MFANNAHKSISIVKIPGTIGVYALLFALKRGHADGSMIASAILPVSAIKALIDDLKSFPTKNTKPSKRYFTQEREIDDESKFELPGTITFELSGKPTPRETICLRGKTPEENEYLGIEYGDESFPWLDIVCALNALLKR